jgi:uncharacterized protein (TIGR02646 family)
LNRFERGEPPDCLAARQEKAAVWASFDSTSCYKAVRQALLACSDETCAFCGGCFAQSTETIEHFVPKSGPHGQAHLTFAWGNLFPACMRCNHSKGDRWNEALLKPDESDYSPFRFLCFNPADGSLSPYPGLSPADTHRVEVTFDLYQLNRVVLKKSRRSFAMQWAIARKIDPNLALDNYRFLQELMT